MDEVQEGGVVWSPRDWKLEDLEEEDVMLEKLEEGGAAGCPRDEELE